MDEEIGFEELKQTPFTKIQTDGRTPVPFMTWRGVPPFIQSGPGDINVTDVRYFLNGNRLRVRRDLTHEEVWYTLSYRFDESLPNSFGSAFQRMSWCPGWGSNPHDA